MRGLAVSLVMVLVLGGCAAKRAYKAGERAEDAGQSWEAAQHYLAALDRRDSHRDANEALGRMGEDALTDALTTAAQQEKSEDFLAAMQWYQQADRYTGRLDRVGHLDFQVPIDLHDKIDEMRAAAAYESYRTGSLAIDERRWADAIKAMRSAQAIVPRFKDSEQRIAEASYRWAEDDIAAARYRAAAQRFTASQQAVSPMDDGLDRAVELYAALGEHHLGEGACRQAVRDLRLAYAVYPTAVSEPLADALECAHVDVLIEPFRGGGIVAGVSVSDWVEAYVRRELPRAASEFVTVTADDKTLSSDVVVRGTVTEAWVNGPSQAETARSVTGRRKRTCQEGEIPVCYEDVAVVYQEHTSVLQARATASIEVQDRRSGRMLGQAQPAGDARSDLRWASGFTRSGGAAIAVSSDPTDDSVGVGWEIIQLRDADRLHPASGALVSKVLEPVGRGALDAVLRAVDIEQNVTDPTSLSLRPLRDK